MASRPLLFSCPPVAIRSELKGKLGEVVPVAQLASLAIRGTDEAHDGKPAAVVEGLLQRCDDI